MAELETSPVDDPRAPGFHDSRAPPLLGPAIRDDACPNCATPLRGAYCHGCGQRAVRDRLRTRRIVGETVANALSFESGFLATVKGLVLRPGHLAREFVEGRRACYVPPVRLFIVFSALYILALTHLSPQTAEEVNIAALAVGAPEKVTGRSARIVEEILRNIPTFMQWAVFVQVPAMALVAWVMFRRPLRPLADHLVLFLYALGAVLVLTAIGLVLQQTVHPLVGGPVAQLASTVYLIWAVAQFYRLRGARVLLAVLHWVVGHALWTGILTPPLLMYVVYLEATLR